MTQKTVALTAAGQSAAMNVGNSELSVYATLSGTYAGAVVAFETSRDGVTWFPVVASRRDGSSAPTNTFTPSTNGSHIWVIPCTATTMVRVRLTALTSGTLSVFLMSTDELVTYPETVSNPKVGAGVPFTLQSVSGTNANLVKSGSGVLYNVAATNMVALGARYVKLYDKATVPVPGTDVPIMVIPLPPAGGHVLENYGTVGLRFQNGIGVAITAGLLGLDVTAISAGDVYLMMNYG